MDAEIVQFLLSHTRHFLCWKQRVSILHGFAGWVRDHMCIFHPVTSAFNQALQIFGVERKWQVAEKERSWRIGPKMFRVGLRRSDAIISNSRWHCVCGKISLFNKYCLEWWHSDGFRLKELLDHNYDPQSQRKIRRNKQTGWQKKNENLFKIQYKPATSLSAPQTLKWQADIHG